MRERRKFQLTHSQIVDGLKIYNSLPENSPQQIRDKTVLKYFFVDGFNGLEISNLKDSRIVSFSNRSMLKPLSETSVLSIIYKYMPELKGRGKSYKSNSKKKRLELMKIRRSKLSTHIKQCAFCGSKNNLEEHHMIPLFMGGTNEEENLVFLCSDCHKLVSSYQERLRSSYGICKT